ncbi:MAG: flagellar basal body P-ring formation chaperone FlgA [Rhodospirillaceae bacterium]
MRNLIFAVLVGLAVAPFGARGEEAKDAAPVMLQTAITVDANVIRLGDFFSGAGDMAETAVAYAPEPGKRSSFDARWLYRAARAYRLDWRPINDRVRTVVTRRSQVITSEEISDTLRDALAERGAGEDTEIEFSNRFVKLHVPGNGLAGIAVDEIDYDPRSHRFNAILSAPAGAADAKQYRISGRLHETIDVPVLNRRVLAGETIRAADIKWMKVRARRLAPNSATSEANLVGMSPRRGLRPDLPVLMTSVRRPVIVEKGSLVTIYLHAPKMVLTAQGKAMEDGSDGDVIRITNTQSAKVVEAEVFGHGKVAVRPTALMAMN